MKFKAFNMTAQGASHIKRNKECQDASQSFTSGNADYALAVVCDGHGGNDYIRSRYGSEKASEIALKNLKEFVECVNPDDLKRRYDVMLNSLASSIIAEWGADVRQHWNSHPITSEEEALLSEKAKKRYLQDHKVESAYGTTLLAIAFTKDYWFGMQVGDGKCVSVGQDSTIAQAIELDEKCFLNATTSLCDSDALERFHFYFSDILPAVVYVGSDGIDDCFKNDAQLYNFYRTVSYSFGSNKFGSAYDELKDFLPRLSQKGSGDDVSIAGILNMDVLPKIDIVKSFNREEEKAKKQKAEEEEARRNAEIKAEYERKAAEIRKRKEEEERRRLEAEGVKEEKKRLAKENKLFTLKEALSEALAKLSKLNNEVTKARKVCDSAKEQFEQAMKVTNNHVPLYKAWMDKEKIYNIMVAQCSQAQNDAGLAQSALDNFICEHGAKCPKCGSIMLSDARFCSKCGNDMSAEPEDVILDGSNSAAEEAKPVDGSNLVAEEAKPVDGSNPVAEEIKPIDEPNPAAEDVKLTDDPKFTVEDVKSVEDPKSVTDDNKLSNEKTNREEVVESISEIDISVEMISNDRINDAGLAILELFNKKLKEGL